MPTIRQIKHELRTPINQLVGFSELLLEEIQDGGDSNDIARLKAHCEVGRALVCSLETVLPNPGGGSFGDEVQPQMLQRLRDVVQGAMQKLMEVDLESAGFPARCSSRDDLRRIVAARGRLARFAETGDLP